MTHRKVPHKVTLFVVSDAGHSDENPKLRYIACLLLGDMRSGWSFYMLSWSVDKSHRPPPSVDAAEILAAGEAIDDGMMMARRLSCTINVYIPLVVDLDSHDVFTFLSTQRNSAG